MNLAKSIGSNIPIPPGNGKKRPLFPDFQLQQWNTSIEDCRVDNIAYGDFANGEVPTLEHWKEVLENAVRNDLKTTDPNGTKILPTRKHIKDVIAEKSAPGSIWGGSTPAETRWRHQVRHNYEIDENKEWEFGGMLYQEIRLRIHGRLVTPIEISYNLILSAHVEEGKHLGRIRTSGKLKAVTQSLKEHSMVAKFIEGCPKCKKSKVNVTNKRVHNDTEGHWVESNKKAKISNRRGRSKSPEGFVKMNISEINAHEFEASTIVPRDAHINMVDICGPTEFLFDGVNDCVFSFDPEDQFYEYPDLDLTTQASTFWQASPNT